MPLDALEAKRVKLAREALELRRQMVEKIAALATAAFGLVAALAWNSAIQEVFKRFFGETDGQIAALISYAVVVTIIAVVVTVYIGRMAARLAPEPAAAPESGVGNP